jgi:hypothetical protein
VAGRVVEGVSLAGLAAGTARGAVPGARLAIYKVCWDDFCASEDMLAAFDDAVADGVDVISFSIGGKLPVPYFEDAPAIGAFHAMRRGVLTSTSAGNSALDGGRVTNVAPWMLSVAASSTDRRLVGRLVLGNGKTIVVSTNSFTEPLQTLQLCVDQISEIQNDMILFMLNREPPPTSSPSYRNLHLSSRLTGNPKISSMVYI